MNSDEVGYDEFCSACIPLGAERLTGFEKVVDFENDGLVIYRCLGKSKNVVRDKRGRTTRTSKTVVIHNTKNTDITSEDFLRELQTRNMTCPRCRQMIELALELLQKVPAINKKVVMGICDQCKLNDACRDCKKTTKSFLENYKAQTNKERTEKLSKINKEAKGVYLNKKTEQHKVSVSELRIEELLNLEYAKAERELDISDLFRHLRTRSAKSLPALDKDNKHLRHVKDNEIMKPSSDSKLTVQKDGKIIFAPDYVHLSNFDDNFEKTIYTPSTTRDNYKTQRMSKTNLKLQTPEFSPVLYPSIGSLAIESITTEDNILVEPRPVLRRQKRKYYKDDEIFPKYPKPYPHEREKYGQKDIYDQYLKTTDKICIEGKEKIAQIPRDESPLLKDLHSVLKKRIKEIDQTPKSYKTDTSQKDFDFSFYQEDNKQKKETARIKTSQELITETHDLLHSTSHEIKRKMIESRLLKEAEQERARLAQEEQARLIAGKKAEAEKTRAVLEEMTLLKKIELGLIVEAQYVQKKGSIDLTLPSNDKKKELDSKELEDKNKKEIDDKNQKELDDKFQKELENETLKELGNKSPKHLEIESVHLIEIKSPKEMDNKPPNEIENKKSEFENKKPKELENKKTTQIKIDSEKKTQSVLQKGEKEKHLQVEYDSSKKRQKHEKTDKMSSKGNANKQLQTLKPAQEFVLGDMIKQKQNLKPKEPAQIARLQNEANKQTNIDTTIKAKSVDTSDKKVKKKNDTNFNFDIVKPKDDAIIMQFKEGAIGPKYTYKGDTLRDHLEMHQKYHTQLYVPSCPFCLHSELELLNDPRKQKLSTECITGQQIVDKNATSKIEPELGKSPMLFYTNYQIPIFDTGTKDKKEKDTEKPPVSSKTTEKGLNTNNAVIRYVLSDRTFIEKGWTVLPTEKVMRKMNVYRMRPAKPEFDWFKRNKDKQLFYDSGERFVEYQDDGRCCWYYKNERLALDYYNAAELNAQQRFVIYSNGEPDERGRARPYTVLAMFDYLGNGVVFDHAGKIRLKYNQTEGVVLDRSIGPVSHWKWHTLNDPPVLQQVMIDTQLAHKDPDILKMGDKEDAKGKHQDNSDNEKMLVIEFENFVKEKSQKLSQNFKPFQIRMKALKINEHFSLKVLDQANVYLIYRDGTTNIKVNIGMLLDHKEIIDTDTAEVGDVANSVERLPARTDSLAAMQETVAYAQHLERARLERKQRLRPAVPRASADKIAAATSRPMRSLLRAYNSSTTTQSKRSYRRPSTNNLYYCTS